MEKPNAKKDVAIHLPIRPHYDEGNTVGHPIKHPTGQALVIRGDTSHHDSFPAMIKVRKEHG